MEISKLKVEIYDFLALIIPGLVVICELAVAVKGWTAASVQFDRLSASGFTLVLLFSFALGTVLQELADSRIKAWKGSRFFKSARDKLWDSPTGDQVKAKIAMEAGREPGNVDVAFDYCLTRIEGSFLKRDLFLAMSDLSRSLVVACCFAVIPVMRIVVTLTIPVWYRIAILIACLAAVLLAGSLCWARMVRFRVLSETPVFHTFLAISPRKD